MSTSEGNTLPGGPALDAGPGLPIEPRTTELAAWRAANEAKSARRRGGFLTAALAARPPAPAQPERSAQPGEPLHEVPESTYPPGAVPLDEPSQEDHAWPVTGAPTAGDAGTPPASTSSSSSSSSSADPTSGSSPATSTTAAATGTALPPRRATPRATARPRVDVKAICEAYVAGATPPQIAAKYGCGVSTVRRALRGAGVHLRDDRSGHSGGRNRTNLTEHDAQRVIEQYTAGMSLADVADATGHHLRVIRRVLVDHGVTIRPPAHIAAKPTDPDIPSPEHPEPEEPPARAPRPSLAEDLAALADDVAAIATRLHALAAAACPGEAS
jgi:hypothetical protein